MNQKSWYVLRIVVSLYLAYLGIQLISDVVKKQPENMVFMLVMAGIFIVTGVLYGIFSIKKVWALKNESDNAQQEDEDADIEEEDAQDDAEEVAEEEDAADMEDGADENNRLKNEEDNVIRLENPVSDDSDR